MSGKIRTAYQYEANLLDSPLGATTPDMRRSARLTVVEQVSEHEVPTVLQALGLIPYDGAMR